MYRRQDSDETAQMPCLQRPVRPIGRFDALHAMTVLRITYHYCFGSPAFLVHAYSTFFHSNPVRVSVVLSLLTYMSHAVSPFVLDTFTLIILIYSCSYISYPPTSALYFQNSFLVRFR